MPPAPLPPNEQKRLADLHSYDVLDTPPEQAFDDFTALASLICGTPIALISLVDADRQWFKSRVGVDVAETPRNVAFCAHAILSDDILEVSDTRLDARFSGNPLVTGPPDIRFYAGAQLTTPGGNNVGTLCVIDRAPRHLTSEQREALRQLGRQVVVQLELRLAGRQSIQRERALQALISERERAEHALSESEGFLRLSQQASGCGSWTVDFTNDRVKWSSEMCRIHGLAQDGFEGTLAEAAAYVHPDDRSLAAAGIDEALRSRQPSMLEYRVVLPCGDERFVWTRGDLVVDAAGRLVRMTGITLDVTARKRVEEALRAANENLEHHVRERTADLRESASLLQSTLNSTADGLLVVDRSGHTKLFNTRFVKMWELSESVASGSTSERIAFMAAQLSEPGGLAPMLQNITSNPATEVRDTLLFTDGRVFEQQVTPWRIDEEIVGQVFSYRDVTTRALAVHALVDKEYLLAESQRIAHIGSWRVDMETSGVSWSDETYHIYGVSPDTFEPSTHSLLGLVHPEDRGTVREWMEMAASGVNRGLHEFRIVRPGGSIRVVNGRGELRHDQHGRPVSMVGTIQDVTDQSHVEQLLHDNERRYHSLLEHSFDLIQSTGPDGAFLFVNKAWRETLGYTPEDVSRLTVFDIIHPDSLAHGRRLFAQASDGHSQSSFEATLVAKDGALVTIEGNLWPHWVDGRLVATQAYFRDLTERHKLEQQFRQAQKMEAVGQLAGGVAHDFNNLLTVIGGHAEVMQMKLHKTDPLWHRVETISQAVTGAAGLTRQLLAFSRKQILKPTILDVNDIVRGFQSMIRRLNGEDVEVVVSLDEGAGKVLADRSQIEQVILNLVVNARDAMSGGGRLTIETANAEFDEHYARHHADVSSGAYTMLAIGDSGTGMDAATQSRIFEPFFTTKGPEHGTGLGLATVYGIVKQSRGHISVYSEPGMGSIFKLYLPHSASALAGESERNEPRAAIRRGTETILVAEDDGRVREITCDCLREAGYTVLEAANGGEALAVAEQHKGQIDLLASDVVMPRMNGRELFEQLRQRRPAIKVLFLSGYTDDMVVRAGIIAGQTYFIQKPFALDTLSRTVRTLLDES